MIFRKKPRDPEERQIFGLHPGDMGVVVIAAIITVAFFVLLLTPKNFAALNLALAPAEAPKPKADPGTPGVTQMQLYDAKKK